MVGQDPHRHVGTVATGVGHSGQVADDGQQPDELVGVPHRFDALEHREDPFQAEAGVDARSGQWGHRPVLVLFELHEHQVPDLDEALLVAVGGPAVVAKLRPPVPEDLRAWAAGASVGHLPVVLLVEALDALGRDAHLVLPYGGRLVIAEVNRHPEAARVEAQVVGHELPGVGAGLGFEVVTETEVAHHLEEGQVAAGPTHLVEVVVLAAGPHALLDGHRPEPGGGLFAHEIRLEGHHARHGEQEGPIVGNQAA